MSAPARNTHHYSQSTPSKPSPLREDITDMMDTLDINEGEKTPKQAVILQRAQDLDCQAPETPTPIGRSMREGHIVVDGKIRKSASTLDLRISAEDDVFGPRTPATASSASRSLNATSTGSSQEAINILNRTAQTFYKARGYNGFQPRMDRGLEPNSANAQGLFSPDANVFVANLSNQRSEDQLEIACHEIFDVFGPNYVKIKSDKNKHPFALVQFETVEGATEAISKAQGTVLDGRQIRLEQTKAERAVIIFKQSGERIAEEEALEILSQYGAIDFVCSTSILRGRSGSLPDGVYARFAFYLDCRDALKGFFSHPSEYRIQLATGVQPTIREATDGSASVKGLTPPRSVTDSKSVFVGNLPEGTTKKELTQLFQRYGTVVDANVVHKAYPGNSINVFGFVEFVTSAEAEAASMQEQYLGDHKLRIEPKEYSARRASRLNAAPIATPVRTPRRISPSASRALAMRLVRNEVDNTYTANPAPTEYAPPTPAYRFHTEDWQTPHHYLPAHLFSPSPPGQPPMYYGPPGFGGEPYYHGGY